MYTPPSRQSSITIGVAIFGRFARPSFTELLHRLKQLLAITVGSKVDAGALRVAPLGTLHELSDLRHVIAKPGSRTAVFQARFIEKVGRDRVGESRFLLVTR